MTGDRENGRSYYENLLYSRYTLDDDKNERKLERFLNRNDAKIIISVSTKSYC